MNDIISLADKNGQCQLYQVEAIDIVDASTGEMPVLADDSQLVLITCNSYKLIGSHTISSLNSGSDTLESIHGSDTSGSRCDDKESETNGNIYPNYLKMRVSGRLKKTCSRRLFLLMVIP
jgi:hypothetical protein